MPDRYCQPPPLTLDEWFSTPVRGREIVTAVTRVYEDALDYNDRLHEHLREVHGVPQSELDAMVERRVPPLMGQSRTYQRDSHWDSPHW